MNYYFPFLIGYFIFATKQVIWVIVPKGLWYGNLGWFNKATIIYTTIEIEKKNIIIFSSLKLLILEL